MHACLGQFKYQAGASPLVRSKSPPTPMSPTTALAEAQEFIESAEETDLSADPGGRTALHLAIVHRHRKVVDILLQHKGEYNNMDELVHKYLQYTSVAMQSLV